MPKVDRFVEAGRLLAHFVQAKEKQFMLDLWEDLANTTPVDTGRARASWRVSGGVPVTVPLPPGEYAYPQPPNLDKYKRNYTKWFLVNTASYIEYLNNGHSQQAPAGFVQAAIQRQIAKHG